MEKAIAPLDCNANSATLRVLQNSNDISIRKMFCKTLRKPFCKRYCSLSVKDIDAVDRVHALGDRMEDLSLLLRFDTSVDFPSATALGAKRRVGRPTVEIPLEAIEGYLSHGRKVKEITDLYGLQ